MPDKFNVTSSAVAIIAAALLLMFSGCGGGSEDPVPTAPAAPGSATTRPSGSTSALSDVDLAQEETGIRIAGMDPEDLLTGAASLAMGDFNDDGKTDLLIGAPQGDGPDNDRTEAGEAYILFGPLERSRDLSASGPDVIIYGGSAGDGLGYSVLSADINDDEQEDVLIGAPGVTAGFDLRTDQGRVYVIYGGETFGDEESLDLSDDVVDLTITGAEGFSRLGHAMAGGDVNGDGAGDVVVGAPFAGRPPGSAPGSERTALGEAYVILGNRSLSGDRNMARDEYDSVISGSFAFGEFASSIVVADLDDDRKDDIVAGAHRSSAGEPARASSGAAYVFYGRSEFEQRISVEDGGADVAIVGATGSTLGYPLASGDFDGDGTADIAVGAQLESSADIQGAGAVHIFFGDRQLADEIDLETESADVRLSGGETSEFLPSALTSVDLDRDGRWEIIAGSMLIGASDDRFGSGVVYVISLPVDAQDKISVSTGAAIIMGQASGDRLGNALGAGSVSEGIPVLVALAPLADSSGRDDAGVVYLLESQP